MPIYYEAKALERTIDAAPRITPSTKSVLKKIIRSAPVADAEPVTHGCCSACKHGMINPKEEPCASCEVGSNWEWRGVVDATD